MCTKLFIIFSFVFNFILHILLQKISFKEEGLLKRETFSLFSCQNKCTRMSYFRVMFLRYHGFIIALLCYTKTQFVLENVDILSRESFGARGTRRHISFFSLSLLSLNTRVQKETHLPFFSLPDFAYRNSRLGLPIPNSRNVLQFEVQPGLKKISDTYIIPPGTHPAYALHTSCLWKSMPESVAMSYVVRRVLYPKRGN